MNSQEKLTDQYSFTNTMSILPLVESNLVHATKRSDKKSIFEGFYKQIKHKPPMCSLTTKSPKKEYIRCKLIRGIKKCLRLLMKKSSPRSIGKFVIAKNTEAHVKWEIMLRFFSMNESILSAFASTRKMIPDGNHRSYNLAFCQFFFEKIEIREIFRQYIDFLFADFEPKRLCEEFNFLCCQKRTHDAHCEEQWKNLKGFILNDMMGEIVLPEEGAENLQENKYYKLHTSEPVEEFRFSLDSLETQPKWIQKLYFREYNIL